MSFIHHIALTAKDLEKTSIFYDGLLEFFAYKRCLTNASICGWHGDGPEILIYSANSEGINHEHKIYQPGFHHIAFKVPNCERVDDVYRWLQNSRAKILTPPQHYPAYPGKYYAVFFTDLDNLKLEVMTF